MIYDCFTFFNELDILEIRLHELDDVVDEFVLVEGTKTFQGEDKPLHYEENKDRFKQFEDRINHVVIDEFPKGVFDSAWNAEHFTRNSIVRGLEDCSRNDTILISDVDEIPRSETVLEVVGKRGIHLFEMLNFYYYLNYVHEDNSYRLLGTMMMDFDTLSQRSPQAYRSSLTGFIDGKGLLPRSARKVHRMMTSSVKLKTPVRIASSGGWHFSYQGGVEAIIEKIEAFSHTEYNKEDIKDEERLKKIIDEGDDLFDRDHSYDKVDIERLPDYIQSNPQKFNDMLL